MKEELLEKYFMNQLSNEEERVFKKLLDTDSDFRQAFEFEKRVQKVAKNTRRASLKGKLTAIEATIDDTTSQDQSEDFSKKKTTPIYYIKMVGIAASFALIIALTWMFLDKNTTSNDDLFAVNYEKYPNTVYNISRSDDNSENLEKIAFTFYEKGAYAKATTTFQNLQDSNNLPYIDFYIAQSYLAQGNEKESLKFFKKNIENGTVFISESLWYQSLILIKTDKKEEAIESLKILINKGSYKKEASEHLLKSLNE